MKHRTKHISVLLVVLASLLLLLVGCSDMMDRMGEIVLQIEPEDTIRTIVARYSLVGNLENSRASVTFDGLAPGEEVRIPKIASGNWSFTVVAFSDQDCKIEIGRGTKSIILIEGQQVNLKVPVVFVPLPLSVSNPTIPNPIKVYDGNTSLEVTVGTLSGYCDGDDKVQVAATANYNDKSVGSGKLITVTHTLVYAKDTAITGKYAPLADYTFTEGVITAKPLTISAPIFPSSQDKEYDGSYTLPVIAGSLIGVVEGDDVSVIATATYDNKDAKINKVITVTYTISGTDAANYIKPADNTTNTGTITKKPLTFTVFADDKTYNGNADATGSITLTGVIEADLLNVGATGTFTFTDADGVVGSDKKVSVTEIMLTGSEKDNYSISGTTAETVGTITKKTFDMTGITFVGQSPTYDTHAHPLAIGGTLPDGVSVSYSSNNTSTQAGTYTVVASFSVDEENHTLIEDMTATLTIQKRALTTEGTYLTLSKAYDKNLTAQVSVDQIVSGKVRGDGIVLSVEAYYEDISVKANKAITVYYTLAGEKIANYTKPENYTVLTGVIRPIQLSISDPSFAETSKAYDGNDSISTTAGILSGVLLTDDRVTVTARANYLTARVENNKYIKVTYTLSGPEDQVKHYTAPESYYTKTGTITKKALTVSTSVDTQIVPSKTYDGTPSARVTRDGNPAGVVGSEQVALVATAVYNSQTVGTGKTISVTYALTGDHAGNYTAPAGYALSTTDVAITKKQLSIADASTRFSTNKPYDGNLGIPILAAGDLDGVVGNDIVTLSAEASYGGLPDIGTKTITVTYGITGSGAGNYTKPGDYTGTGAITARQLTIGEPRFSTTSKTYDGNAGLSVEAGTLGGVIATEQGAVTVQATAAYGNEEVGANKAITVSYALTYPNANYLAPVASTINTGTITPRKLTIGDPNFTNTIRKEYDGSGSVAFTKGNVTGLYDPSDVTVNATGEYLDAGVGTNKHIRVTYSLTGTKAANYTAPDSYLTTSGEITKKALTVSTSVDTQIVPSKTYDGTPSARVTRDGNPAGVVGSEQVALVATAVYNSQTVGTGKTISVTYALTGDHAGNYTAPAGYALSTTDVAITKKQLVARAPSFPESITKAYDRGTALAVTAGALIGVHADDDVMLSAVAQYATSDVGRAKTVTVSYSLAGSVADCANYIEPGNYTIYTGEIRPIQLSISDPSLTASKLYDGTTDVAVTQGLPSGVLSGDAVRVNATAAYADKNVGMNKVITVSYALAEANANYLAPVGYTMYTGSITPIQLGIGAPASITASKTYDGNASASITAGALSGVLQAETGIVFVDAVASHPNKNVGSSMLSITYSIRGDGAGNYTAPINTASYTCSITAKPLTVSAGTTRFSTNKPYDGNLGIPILAAGDLDGVVGNDIVTLSAEASYGGLPDIGTKTITVTYGITGSGAGNYTKPGDYTGTGAITARQLTIGEPRFSTTSKTYDGNAGLSVESGTLGGVIATEQGAVTVQATAAYGNEEVGANKAITVSYALTYPNANYLAPVASTINTGTITPRKLTIGDPNFTNTIRKEYDGSGSVAFTKGNVTGLYDPSDVTVNATGEYLDAGVGTNKHIRVTYSLTGTKAANYTAPDSYLTTSGEITKKALTVSTSVDTQIVPSKTYDGTPSARVTRDGNPAGVVGSEQVALVATAVYNSQTVGTGKTISVTYALTGDHAGNYTAPAGYALSTTGVAITTKQLSVAAGTTQITAEKLFDETNVAEVIEPGTLDGVVGNDLVILGATAFYNNETIGTGKAITVVYSLTGADSGNYAAPDRNGTSFTGSISRGQLTISDPSLVKTKIYNSADDCIVFPSNSVQGIVGSDVVQVEAKATFADKHVGANKKITVVYSLSGKDALKYTKPVDYVTHDGEIQHKELIISAPTGFTTSKPYDGNASVAFTPGTVSGRYDGDSVNVVANGFYLSPTVANDKRIFFTYTLSGPDAANYIRPSYDVIENAEITKKVLTVQAGTTVIVSEKTYNKTADAVVTRPGMLDGLVVGSEDVSLSATASYLNANAGEVKDIVVTYSISGRDAVKYTAPAPLTIRDGTINRLLLTIADPSFPAGKDRAYNGSTTLDVTAGDLIGLLDEGITVSAAANYGGKDASPTPWTITVAYTLGGTGSDNYLKPVDTTVLGTIDKKQLAIYSQNLTTSKAYDGNATAVISHVALAGIVSNEDVSILSSTATYDTEGVGTGKTITVSYVLGGSHAGNYLEPLDTTAVGAIDRKQLTIYSQNLTTNRDYDGTAAAAISGVTLSGIVLSENVVVNPTATYDTKDQGTGKNITVSYALSGTHAGNYLKPIDNMFVGTVNRKQLTVASQNLSTNRDYDGTAAAAISGVTLSGIMLSENVVVNPTATYDTKNQGAGKTITLTYPLSGTDIGNYLQPNTTTIGGTINRKQLTVSSQNLTINKVYDGTATAAISGVVLSGFVHSENVVVNPTATYNSKDVSTANKITVIYPISGTDIGNYLQPGNTAVEGAISQKQLAIASQNLTTSKAYNGNANAAISGVTLDGVISGDRVTVSATATYDSMEIGTGKTITVSYALGDSHAGNYLKPADTTFTGAISQRMVAVSGTITDSSTGYGLGGVVVSASGLPDTTTTNTSGYFSMTIPSGARTLHFSHADYNLASINIPDNGGTSFQIPQNAIIGNKLLPEGQLRMVLTWGSSPSDLDFYLRTPSSGTVYYGTKTVEGANLDVDDTSSYGPETITITSIQNGTYSCYVHNYSGGSFSYSEATVRLYDRTGLIRTFTVPTSGPGLYWNVFTYTNGTITTVNQVSSSPI